jgi:ribonuclease-3
MISERLGYTFKDEKLLNQALTHCSKSVNNYERLEFLGDSILDFIVGEYFFKNTDKKEGELTVFRSRFISEQYLSKVFDELELEKDVIVGKSYKGAISKAIKCDIIEAIIAGIYLEAGLERAKQFIEEKLHLDNYNNIEDNNFKSQLQELIQANFKCKMSYVTEKIDDKFISKFYMDDDEIAMGEGLSKIEAEQNCARVVINLLFKV